MSAGETEVHCETKVDTFNEPKPVARSYPVLELNPMLLTAPHALVNGT